MNSEFELIEQIKSDPKSFGILFSTYYKPIFNYIFRRTGDFNCTVEIVAETFLKAFTHIQKFEYRGTSIKIWLYRIATNEANLSFKKKKRTMALFKGLESDPIFKAYLIDDREELELELQKNEQFILILNAVKSLPGIYQDVITLKYFEGKGNREISEILEIKEGTIKSLLSRGLKKLKKSATNLGYGNY